MAIYVKAFVFVLFVYAISALPLNEGQQEEPQVDLYSVESVPEQDSVAASSNDNEELTRAKRHGELLRRFYCRNFFVASFCFVYSLRFPEIGCGRGLNSFHGVHFNFFKSSLVPSLVP